MLARGVCCRTCASQSRNVSSGPAWVNFCWSWKSWAIQLYSLRIHRMPSSANSARVRAQGTTTNCHFSLAYHNIRRTHATTVDIVWLTYLSNMIVIFVQESLPPVLNAWFDVIMLSRRKGEVPLWQWPRGALQPRDGQPHLAAEHQVSRVRNCSWCFFFVDFFLSPRRSLHVHTSPLAVVCELSNGYW